jgi:hypothetical protein
MLNSKCGRNNGHEPSEVGVEFCRTIYGSLIKHLLVNLKMIFGKNHGQSMLQVQFKFTPLPAELARVCFVCGRLMQSFTHKQTIGDIYKKCVLLLLKIWVV